jgi:hypothetical protein
MSDVVAEELAFALEGIVYFNGYDSSKPGRTAWSSATYPAVTTPG